MSMSVKSSNPFFKIFRLISNHFRDNPANFPAISNIAIWMQLYLVNLDTWAIIVL